VVGVIEDELYGQGEEVRLLAALVPHLRSRSLVDVGAERGSFAQAMLDGGIERVRLRAGARERHRATVSVRRRSASSGRKLCAQRPERPA
jgi:hypothetical protein